MRIYLGWGCGGELKGDEELRNLGMVIVFDYRTENNASTQIRCT